MSLINQAFLIKQIFYLETHKAISSIKIKNIEIKIHDNPKYMLLNFFFKGKCHKEVTIAYVKTKFYLIKNFKAKILIEINVLKFEKITLNFNDKSMTNFTCKNIKVLIIFYRKRPFVNCIIRAAT